MFLLPHSSSWITTILVTCAFCSSLQHSSKTHISILLQLPHEAHTTLFSFQVGPYVPGAGGLSHLDCGRVETLQKEISISLSQLTLRKISTQRHVIAPRATHTGHTSSPSLHNRSSLCRGFVFLSVRFPHHGPFALAHWSPSSRTHPPGHSR